MYQRELSILRVDSKGVIHILYINQTEEAGVYYIRSEDRGITWSEPVWLDPDILPGHIPDSLNFEVDENDGLHAVWMYGTREEDDRPDWVRYAHSLDGGHTWSAPILIDQYDEETDHNLTTAGPGNDCSRPNCACDLGGWRIALSLSSLFNRCRANLECAGTDLWRVTRASI